MRIIGAVSSHQHLAIDQNYYLLENDQFPFIVYEYDPIEGIVGLSYDTLGVAGYSPRTNIEDIYKKGRYQSAKGKEWSYSRRLTTDSFAACRTE